MINKGISGVGAVMFIIGIAGIAGACEGQGSFLISAVVFSIGFGLSWFGLKEA